MGLDQYLEKQTYVQQWEHQKPEEKIFITVKKGDKIHKRIKPERISYITEQVMYWRKANAIHKWFTDNCYEGKENNGEEIYVSSENIKKLLDDIQAVLDDTSLAESILPTESGFFFGTTEYDEWYFDDLRKTKDCFENLLKEDPEAHYYYRASW